MPNLCASPLPRRPSFPVCRAPSFTNSSNRRGWILSRSAGEDLYGLPASKHFLDETRTRILPQLTRLWGAVWRASRERRTHVALCLETTRPDSTAAIAAGSREPGLNSQGALNFRVHRTAGEKPSAPDVVSHLEAPKGKTYFPRAGSPAWPGFHARKWRGSGRRRDAKLRWVTA